MEKKFEMCLKDKRFVMNEIDLHSTVWGSQILRTETAQYGQDIFKMRPFENMQQELLTIILLLYWIFIKISSNLKHHKHGYVLSSKHMFLTNECA